MGTGIVSVGLSTDDRHTLSRVLLVIAAAIWVALALLLAARTLRDRARVRREAHSPAALTGVAATAVLGARATGLGWSAVAAVLLVIATCVWLMLIWPVMRGWTTKTQGVSFMVSVAPHSLAVLAAQLALREHTSWLLYVSIAPFVLGVVLYLVVLASFDFRQLLEGGGDHWISGGAIGITAMAAARISIGAHHLHVLGAATGSLRTLSLVLWALAVAWLPPLLAAEVLRPRPRYDVRRWATVFPVGMYAACSFDAGQAARAHGLVEFGRVCVWLGFGLWVVVFAAMVWHSRTLVAGEAPATEARRVEEVAPGETDP
jgi:tellurite resistance protein TehA-like permease